MTIQQISIRETNYAIRWIVIYPVDSTIQRLSNQALDDEIVVDVVLDDGIGVDVVLDDEVVVEVDEMVANGVAVVRLGVGFDVVAVTPKKKEVFNRFDNNQFICCSNSCVEFPCLYQLKIQCESYFKEIKLSLSFYMYIFFLVQP